MPSMPCINRLPPCPPAPLARRLAGAAVLALVAAGCGDSGTPAGGVDLNVIPDFGVGFDSPPHPVDLSGPDLRLGPDAAPPADLSMPDLLMPDFTVPADLALGPDFAVDHDLKLPPDLVFIPDLTGVDEGRINRTYQYVMNSLSAPSGNGDFPYDLNGDGTPDNAFIGLVQALSAYSIMVQSNFDTALSQGSHIELFAFTTADVMRQNDNMPIVVARPGIAKPNPDYSGQGMFGVDNNQPSSTWIQGALQQRKYYSFFISIMGQNPVDLKLRLYLFGDKPVDLVIHGAHIEFVADVDQKSGAPGLIKGQYNGSITKADLTNILIPAIAAALTDQVANNGPSAGVIENQIDTGNCVNSHGQLAKALDKIIDDCEVLQSPGFNPVLQPDVTIYDQNGKYMPDPMNRKPDSYSIGLGFNAVQASF